MRNGLREMKSSFVRYLGVYATFPKYEEDDEQGERESAEVISHSVAT
jgi:hypothetical protein